MQRIKQDALASMLGVTQAAVSRWENGLDHPSAAVMARLRNLMATHIRDELAVDRLYLARQSSPRALFDVDGVRLLDMSRGMETLWPALAKLRGRMLQDAAVGEIRHIMNNADLVRDIKRGEVALISGVSIQNIRFQRENPFLHRWHVSLRQIGSRMVGDMMYETAQPDDAVGVHEIIRLDTL